MSKASVYLVEDDALIALELQECLKEGGFDIVGHSVSGEEALEKIPEIKPDCVLFDINLAGKLDGIETAERLVQKLELPFVFLSALTDELVLQRARLAQPFGYLVKPFEPAELLTTLQLALSNFEKYRAEDATAPVESQDSFTDIPEGALTKEGIKNSVLSSLSIFSDLDDECMNLIADTVQERLIEGGTYITNQGESSGYGFVVLSGRMAVTRCNEDGKELITALLGAGDCDGLFFIMENFAEAFSARAQTDSRVLMFDYSLFKQLIVRSPKFCYEMMTCLAESLRRAGTISTALAFSKVETRIINALLALAPSFGKMTVKNEFGSRIFITRKELADFVGTSPETAIRVTKRLEREDILDLSRPGIIKIPDVRKLRDLTAD